MFSAKNMTFQSKFQKATTHRQRHKRCHPPFMRALETVLRAFTRFPSRTCVFRSRPSTKGPLSEAGQRNLINPSIVSQPIPLQHNYSRQLSWPFQLQSALFWPLWQPSLPHRATSPRRIPPSKTTNLKATPSPS